MWSCSESFIAFNFLLYQIFLTLVETEDILTMFTLTSITFQYTFMLRTFKKKKTSCTAHFKTLMFLSELEGAQILW